MQKRKRKADIQDLMPQMPENFTPVILRVVVRRHSNSPSSAACKSEHFLPPRVALLHVRNSKSSRKEWYKLAGCQAYCALARYSRPQQGEIS